MQTIKETASNIAASARSGMEKTKATLEEKSEKMMTTDPIEKQMATQKKEDKINQAELEKREAREHNAAASKAAAAGGMRSASYSTTGQTGHGTGAAHQMSALPGHGTGQPTGPTVEGTAKTTPIGKQTGTGRTTAHNSRAGGGPTGFSTGGGYSG